MFNSTRQSRFSREELQLMFDDLKEIEIALESNISAKETAAVGGVDKSTNDNAPEGPEASGKTETVVEEPASKLKGEDAEGKPSTEASKEPTPLQAIKITRVPPERWREVKKERKIDLSQSTLLTSAKGSSSLVLQENRRAYKRPQSETKTKGKDSEEPGLLYAPYRLAINSTYLLGLLVKITGAIFTEEQNVLIRPFKYLVSFESSIREALEVADTICERATAELDQFIRNFELSAKSPSDKESLVKKREDTLRVIREHDEIACLVEFMDRDMSDIFEAKREIESKSIEKINFENLWQLFKPGDVIYRCPENDEVQRQAYRILHVTGGRVCFDKTRRSSFDPVDDRKWQSDSENDERSRETVRCAGTEMTSFIIDCFYLDSDGTSLAPRGKRFVISPYRGEKPINVLPVQHSSFTSRQESIDRKLIGRGTLFLKLAQRTHMLYHGRTLHEVNRVQQSYNCFDIQPAEIHGEVMIDQASGVQQFKARFFRWSLKTGGSVIYTPTRADKREVMDFFPKKTKADGDWVSDVFDDAIFEESRRQEFTGSTEMAISRIIQNIQMSDDELMLLPPRLYGYSLLDHRWASFFIDRLSDISTKTGDEGSSKLEDLVLPDRHKTILQALITHQVRPSSTGLDDPYQNHASLSMDAVPAKGKGLIILLHGAPGVGKTSTAECIATKLKRPLLPITCGDIGVNSQEAERNLDTFCRLAHRWRCVLLLNEADVFLAKRERGDIKRNSLVSVFLRVLEYFSGVIILTTNRVGEFDEAFRSRIHICLYYPKLQKAQTKEIWEKNIQRIKNSGLGIEIEDKKIRKYVDEHWRKNLKHPTRRWNGRQIKNAFQTAIALANWDFHEEGNVAGLQCPLITVKHFRHVAKISAHFDDYISEIHGAPEEDIYGYLAERDGLRKDSESITRKNPDTGSARSATSYQDPRAIYGRRGAEHMSSRRRDPYDSFSGSDEDFRRRKNDESEATTDEDIDAESDSEVERLEREVKLARLKKEHKKKQATSR